MNNLPERGGLRPVDLFLLALNSLGSNVVRSLLTILGVSIGVFSVVIVMTALSAVRQSIDNELKVFGANVLQVSRNSALEANHGPRRSRRPPITPKQALDFKEMMDAEGLPTSIMAEDRGERASYREKRTNPSFTIIGSNENFLLTNKYELEAGRNLTLGDIDFNRPVAVVGQDLVGELFPNEDPLDKLILLDGNRYLIVGILAERGEIFGQAMDNIALIPFPRFVANNWNHWRSMDINVQAPSPEEMPSAENTIIGAMRLARELEPEDENNFEITSNEALQAIFAEIALLVGMVSLGVSGVALVCAGVGIMAIMLVSVTERTREIGVRKALGARKRNILLQFLLESVFLSEAGAAFGILGGVVLGNVIATFLNASMIIPWFWMTAAVIVCSIIGVGFGMYPAWRAAKLDPVEALRYE
tara:strand:- start:3128 stop:4381 length:1254 start_codon:yes stop_codon:yes gene_type:complete